MLKLFVYSVIFFLSVEANADSYDSIKSTTFEKLYNQAVERIKSKTSQIPLPDDKKRILEADNRYYLKITAKDKYERTKLLELGVDIFSISDSYVEGTIPGELLGGIEKEFSILERKPLSLWISENKDFPPQDSAYHNYNETYQALKELSQKYSDIAYLFSIGKSYEGRDIWALRINTTQKGLEQSKKPGILLVGNHHAREHLTNEMVLLFAAYLLDNRDSYREYIDKLDIYIIPMLNPDGVEYDIKTGDYKWWRKNTNKLDTSSIIGVDLNRNYDFEWCKSGSSHYQQSDVYCGKSAFSEPETKALRDFLLQRRNIKTSLSYHSYASLVLYPWGGRDEPVSDEKDRAAFIKHANEMAKLLGYKAEQSSELYIASGDMSDWAYDRLKILAFTIELEGKSFYPGASIIQSAFEKNKKAIVYLMGVTENPY